MRQSASPPANLKRADAERNRKQILAAAKSAFADSAGEVSMAEISRRAGVGMATLYRNFESRRSLLEALYTDEVDAICEAANDANRAETQTALTKWLRRFFEFVRAKRNVGAEILEHSSESDPVFSKSRNRVLAAGRPLLAAAQAAHEIRDDVNLEQILDLIVAIAKIGGKARYIEPILETAIDGLRVRSKVKTSSKPRT